MLHRSEIVISLFVLVELCSGQQRPSWHFKGPNIALRKPTRQYPGVYKHQTASLAVDGYSGYDNPKHCSHTNLTGFADSAWWMVDLEDNYFVTGIKIYNREPGLNRQRLSGFYIYGHTEHLNSTIYSSKIYDYAKTRIDVELNGDAQYHAISIHLPVNRYNSYLTLCEVEVYARCSAIDLDLTVSRGQLTSGERYSRGREHFNTLDSVINITCKSGYFPLMPYSFQCQHDRTYNASKPYCRVKCILPVVYNGDYNILPPSLYPTSYIIEVTCRPGYMLIGQRQRTCQLYGTWSGPDPKCTVVMCKVPTVQNGHFVNSNTAILPQYPVAYETVLRTVCDPGYVGLYSVISCRADRQWTHNGPFCKKKSCGIPNDLDHGHYTFSNGDPIPITSFASSWFTYNKELYVHCEEGYTSSVTQNKIVCTATGDWSAQPTCRLGSCTLPHFHNGYYYRRDNNVLLTAIHFQDVVYAECVNESYALEGDKHRTCLANGALNGSQPTCVPLCKVPDDEHGEYIDENKRSVGGTYIKEGTIISLVCSQGFGITNGNATYICKADHSWKGRPADCKAKTCSITQLDANENNITSLPRTGLVDFNTTVQLDCKEGHARISGQPSIRCGESKRFEGDILRCKAKSCNLSQLPLQANNIIVNHTDQSVTFNTTLHLHCKDGFDTESGLQQLRCNHRRTFDGDPLMCRESRSSESSPLGMIGGVVGGSVGVVAIIVVVGIILFRRRRANLHSPKNKRRHSVELSTTNTSMTFDNEATNEYSYAKDTEIQVFDSEAHVYNTIQADPEPDSHEYYSFTVEKLPESAIRVTDLVQVALAGDDTHTKFKQEFESFPKGMTASHSSATKMENRGKNKYKELYAYDKTRVVLQPGNLKSETDYINACFINGFSLSNRYIAAQAPFEPTLSDFWRMIWQTDVSKIVMLTKLKEEEKVKCEQYWPKKGTEMYGRVQVTLKSTELYSDFTIRTFVISKDNSAKRTVIQFHFTAWPDKDVPKFASSLVHFRQKAMNTKAVTKGPVVVHCSAGIGRTGTFIALDILFEQGNRLGYVDVMGCVQTLRKQRVMMVQTLDQYKFIHFALIEALMLSPSVLPASSFISTYKESLKMDAKTGERKLDSEFEMLRKMSPAAEESQYMSAKEIRNRKKNRYPDILPVEDFMPRLKGESGEDYINAVFLPSYKMKNAFIITQSPLENTQEEFWRLVFDHNVHTIIMMNTISEFKTEAEIYWPQGEEPLTHDDLNVCLIEEEAQEGHNILTFEVAVSNKKRKLKLFQYCYQSRVFPGPPESILTLMELVLYWQQQTGNNPVVVHCMDGVEKSGLYCVISAVIERLKIEQDVAISQTIEVMRNCREQLISSVEQFKFCHDVVLAYINQFETYSNFKDIQA